MSNNIRNIEKLLRAFSKRCKEVKYSKGLLLSFLMSGVLSYATGMTKRNDPVKEAEKQLATSIEDMKKLFKEARKENNRLLRNSNLELIQLMEQGDHVVKSPWSSWQFGMGYFHSNWRGAHKGRGDKAEKYPYEGIYTRYQAGTAEQMYRYMTPELSPTMYRYVPITSDSKAASSSSRQGLIMEYGLISTADVLKKPVSIKLNASINPKDVGKKSPTSLPSAPDITLPIFEPRLISLPEVPNSIQVNAPSILQPPQINFKGKGFNQDAKIGMPKSNIIVQNYETYDTVNKNTDKEGIINIEVERGGVKWWGSNLDGTRNEDVQLKVTTSIPNQATTGVTQGGFNPAGAGTFYLESGTVSYGTSDGLNAFINELRDHNARISGNYVITNKGGIETLVRNTIFLSHNPAGVGGGRSHGVPGGIYDGLAKAEEKRAIFDGTLTIHGTSTPITGNSASSHVTIGVEHQL